VQCIILLMAKPRNVEQDVLVQFKLVCAESASTKNE
jgi:hypothetical protein